MVIQTGVVFLVSTSAIGEYAAEIFEVCFKLFAVYERSYEFVLGVCARLVCEGYFGERVVAKRHKKEVFIVFEFYVISWLIFLDKRTL